MSVPDVELVSEWSEVDAAAQAIKNGVQKSQMAAGVQASLGKADSALQGATGLPQLGEGRAVCNTAADTAAKVATVQGSGTYTLREGSMIVCYFANAVPAGATLNVSSTGAKDIFFNNMAIKAGMIGSGTYALLQYHGTLDKWVLIVTSTGPIWAWNQTAKTPSMTTPIGVDSFGKLWADTLMHDDAREALLALFAKCAYVSDDAQDDYDRLALALSAQLLYIEADYAQDRTIYYTDSLDVLREDDDLIVTAYYDDGNHYDVGGYTLSGTFEVGTSEITVSYGGKTTTFNVTVSEKYNYSFANGDLQKVNGGIGQKSISGLNQEVIDQSTHLPNTRRTFVLSVGPAPLYITQDQSTYTPSQYYPIRIPADATGVTIAVTPNTGYVAITCGAYENGNLSNKFSGTWTAQTVSKSFTAGLYDYITVVCKAASGSNVAYTTSTEPTNFTIQFTTA